MNNEKLQLETATFAGGCFWCIETAFSNINGVLEVQSGYTGGHVENPTYQEVCSHTTGHFGVVNIGSVKKRKDKILV